jgi:hypothetical protein
MILRHFGNKEIPAQLVERHGVGFVVARITSRSWPGAPLQRGE